MSEQSSIIYNVTVKVDPSIATPWLQWMKVEHIPEVLATKCFERYQLVKLIDVDESDGPTFAIQYYAQSMADYNRYVDVYAASLRQKSFDKWGNNFIAFRSVMEIVH